METLIRFQKSDFTDGGERDFLHPNKILAILLNFLLCTVYTCFTKVFYTILYKLDMF